MIDCQLYLRSVKYLDSSWKQLYVLQISERWLEIKIYGGCYLMLMKWTFKMRSDKHESYVSTAPWHLTTSGASIFSSFGHFLFAKSAILQCSSFLRNKYRLAWRIMCLVALKQLSILSCGVITILLMMQNSNKITVVDIGKIITILLMI